MTREEAEALGYEVSTRLQDVEGHPPKVAVVRLERGTTQSPWAAVEQTLPGPDLSSLPRVLDDLVVRINEPLPPEPEPQEYVDPLAQLELRVKALEDLVQP